MTTLRYRKEWIEDGSLAVLIDAINEGTSPNADGSVQFVDHDFNQYFFLLTDAFEYPSSVTRTDMGSFVYRACVDIRKTRAIIRREELLKRVESRVRDLLAQSPESYSMWTKLRIRQMAFSPGFRMNVQSVKLEGRHQLPKWMRLEKYFISGIGHIDPNTLPFFGYLICKCKARTENEAAKLIFDACDVFNAAVNLSWRFRDLLIQRQPQATLWLGPYQFFFRKQKFLGQNRIWYNGNFSEEYWDRFPKSLDEVRKRLPRVRRSIDAFDGHPLGNVLKRSMVLISEGMTSDDLSFRLMRFWSALETLYSDKPNAGTPSKKLIDRATFPEQDAALSALKLRRLSDLRNKYVHEGTTEGDDNDLVQFLREMLCQHISYLLYNGRDFDSHGEFLAMADLPRNAVDLAARKLAVERRERIMASGRHRAS